MSRKRRDGDGDVSPNGSAELPPLPEGWCWTTLGEISDIEGGITKDQKRQKTATTREVPYLRVANVQRGYLDLREVKTILADEDEVEALRLKRGDILFTEGGDRDKLGRGWIWNDEITDCIHQNHIFRARLPLSLVEPKFISYHGNFFGQDWFTRTGKQTTNLASINKGILTRFPVPLAPLGEQRRIVAKIDELFSDLDAGVAALERVRGNLKRYRASVLKAAVEGRLTEEWRADHPDVEPASVLLERILTERRRKWEEDQLTKFTAAGKEPPKGWRSKYQEPIPPAPDEEPSLPEGWCWASLDQLCPIFSDCPHRTPKYSPTGYPALRPRDVVDGRLLLDKAAKVSNVEYGLQTKKRVPQPGDVIFSRELSFGWAVVVPDEASLCMSQGMVLFRPVADIDSRYLIYVINGPIGRRQSERAAVGTAHPHINLGDIKRLLIPLPPTAEQAEIASAIGYYSSIVDELENELDANLRRAARLRQSILKRAFEGRLVPQDPDDEPADRLLDRIRRARDGGAADPTGPAVRPNGRPRGRHKKASSQPTWFD